MLPTIIGIVIDKTIGFRVAEEDEITGIDQVEHAETGYELQPAPVGGAAPAPPSRRAASHDAEKRVDA